MRPSHNDNVKADIIANIIAISKQSLKDKPTVETIAPIGNNLGYCAGCRPLAYFFHH